MSRTLFFLQNDTKINDFDEGILNLEPFSWGSVIFKIFSFCIKSHVWGREEFLWVASPDSHSAKLRNECLLFIHAGFALQNKSRHFTRGSQTMENIWYVNCDFWDRKANLENDKSWKWHCLRKTATESKRLPQNERFWCHLAQKRILYAIMHTTFSFCPLVFLKLLIISVAF